MFEDEKGVMELCLLIPGNPSRPAVGKARSLVGWSRGWLAGFRLLCWLQWVRFNGYLLTALAVVSELFLELEKLGRLI
jgi:hypothetical protein